MTATIALLTTGCGPGSGPTVSLTSDDPAGRIPAIKGAAQRKDQASVPKLVELLSSDDPAERFYAIEALRRITGKTMGYNYYGSEQERAQAIDRWKASIAPTTQPR
ncbi:HEAT repeat domain-containing protein [Humisphaera borealis]|uniref:HEAT repeat domain-containing protein n=1 Tax=Humisphaera borealis TaxID=2807512 RepID=A0A7M2WQG9_9BACT|nr:HEAT repeat domain-containing protein [Humisphaera borealis]QOV87482.1 HEAT repeat domain-containing protein [Humisphaera borealis]